jgi:hypothetical protein
VKAGGHEQFNHDPDEIQRHIDEAARDRERQPFVSSGVGSNAGSQEAMRHFNELVESLKYAAVKGDVPMMDQLIKMVDHKEEIILSPDENNWQAIHEAIRGGHLDAVKYLMGMGADLGSEVNGGLTALSLAKKILPPDSDIIEFLVSIGAPESDEL